MEPTYKSGQIILSPGGTHSYKIVGVVCRLYDREQLPYPCCSLEWKGKQPSWNRIGKRLIADLGSKYQECYTVEILNCPIRNYSNRECHYLTLSYRKMSVELQKFWYGSKARK
jgi:hypothetical protein